MTDVEKQFYKDMINICNESKKCGYNPARFLQLVGALGPLKAAKQVINKSGGTEGLTTLWQLGRLDLSVESYVIKPEYASLFSVDEISKCKETLLRLGYKVD